MSTFKFLAHNSVPYARGGSKKRGYSMGTAQFRTSKAKPAPRRSSRSRTIPRKVKGLSKQVKELKRLAEADMGTHIHRTREVNSVISVENMQEVNYIVGSDVAKLEAVLGQLRYYDPSNPGTLIEASGNLGSFQKDFYFSRVHSKVTIRNNYQVPCEVRLYCCTPKDDTSIDVVSAYQDGLVDMGNPGFRSPLVFVTDSKLFGDLWRIKRTKIKLLKVGSQFSMSWNAKPFQYDPSLVDSHNQFYQSAFQAVVWMIFVKGVPAHDTTSDQQGTCGAGIDAIVDTVFEVKYPAGADITYITVDDASSSFSNDARVSNQPIADNQTFAQA